MSRNWLGFRFTYTVSSSKSLITSKDCDSLTTLQFIRGTVIGDVQLQSYVLACLIPPDRGPDSACRFQLAKNVGAPNRQQYHV